MGERAREGGGRESDREAREGEIARKSESERGVI